MKISNLVLVAVLALGVASCETETEYIHSVEEIVVVNDSIIDNTVVIPYLDVAAVGHWQSQTSDTSYRLGTNGMYKMYENGVAVRGGALSSDIDNEFLFLEGENITYRLAYELVGPSVLNLDGELFDRIDW